MSKSGTAGAGVVVVGAGMLDGIKDSIDCKVPKHIPVYISQNERCNCLFRLAISLDQFALATRHA
jgi:hypothetical protein